MQAHVFFNPAAAAGRSALRLGVALASLRALGAQVELRRPASAEAARAEIAALAGHAERVIVVGGDGMVHQAANALVGSSTALGIISAGTGNDTVGSLGLPEDVEAACASALAEPKPIDVIESAAGIAVTVATAGFSVAVNERADDMKRVKSGIKYTLSSLVELPKLTTHQMTMSLDGVETEIEANLIAVANTTHFGGGMMIAPEATIDDGLLDVVVIGPASRAVFAAVLPMVFSGRHVKSKYVTVHQAHTVTLDSPGMALRADGERYGELPAAFTVRPKALLVAGADAPAS